LIRQSLYVHTTAPPEPWVLPAPTSGDLSFFLFFIMSSPPSTPGHETIPISRTSFRLPRPMTRRHGSDSILSAFSFDAVRLSHLILQSMAFSFFHPRNLADPWTRFSLLLPFRFSFQNFFFLQGPHPCLIVMSRMSAWCCPSRPMTPLCRGLSGAKNLPLLPRHHRPPLTGSPPIPRRRGATPGRSDFLASAVHALSSTSAEERYEYSSP